MKLFTEPYFINSMAAIFICIVIGAILELFMWL